MSNEGRGPTIQHLRCDNCDILRNSICCVQHLKGLCVCVCVQMHQILMVAGEASLSQFLLGEEYRRESFFHCYNC